MDKRYPNKPKERGKSAKKYSKNIKSPQILLQKDIIYCKNTIQNNNPNINININIKSNKNKSSNNRIRSAKYTINSWQFSHNNSLGKNKPYEFKNIFFNKNINNNTLYYKTSNSNSKKKSIRTYLAKTQNNSNPKLKKNNFKKINLNLKG